MLLVQKSATLRGCLCDSNSAGLTPQRHHLCGPYKGGPPPVEMLDADAKLLKARPHVTMYNRRSLMQSIGIQQHVVHPVANPTKVAQTPEGIVHGDVRSDFQEFCVCVQHLSAMFPPKSPYRSPPCLTDWAMHPSRA